MGKNEEYLFTIGELAKLVGVSVRTLQYYDQINLLNSTYNANHKRVYTRDDLLKILQILFLKSLGMPLQKIKNKLLESKHSGDLKEIFIQQRESLLNQIANLNKIINVLDYTISELKVGQDIGLDRLIAIAELMKNGKSISDKLRELDKKGIDPASKEGQELAKHWWIILEGFVGGDIKSLKSLTIECQDVYWPDDLRHLKKSTEKFLQRILNIYFYNNIKKN